LQYSNFNNNSHKKHSAGYPYVVGNLLDRQGDFQGIELSVPPAGRFFVVNFFLPAIKMAGYYHSVRQGGRNVDIYHCQMGIYLSLFTTLWGQAGPVKLISISRGKPMTSY